MKKTAAQMDAEDAEGTTVPRKPVAAKDIYQTLREMILSFELYPGSRVTETELADYFGVSRTPVR